MGPHTTTLLDDVLPVLRALGSTDGPRPVPSSRPSSALSVWRTGELHVDVAVDDRGRRQLLNEVAGRRWAAAHGIATPALLAVAPDASWVVSQRVQTVAPTGPAYVESVLECARRIAAAPPVHLPYRRTWRTPRSQAATRAWRGVVGGVPTAEWLHHRTRARRLTPSVASHGDFYPANVLALADGTVSVVDWEFAGAGVAYGDEARMWTLLASAADRALLLQRLLDRDGEPARRALAVLLPYMALRLLGENVKADPRHRNVATTRHARAMIPEARAAALRLEGRT
jgi:hypothetical protein